jgi:hypothetical protein
MLKRPFCNRILCWFVGGLLMVSALTLRADDSGTDAATDAPKSDTAKDPPGLVRLSEEGGAWFDPARKLVVVDGTVCLREGQLELFACPRGTKEHESVVSVAAKPFNVHAGLLRIGAQTGNPASYDPTYVSATGTPIDVWILWKDKQGNKRTARAQEWIKNTRTGKQMEHPWVFAGSSFWTDEETGQRYYNADGGDFICVSNFPTAMLDVPVESSQANAELLFEAFTERIPARGTHVRLLLIPRLEPKTEKTGSNAGDSKPPEREQ